ncbi:MAG: ECF transporter S component [Cellulosilyticaceae bacterium]
MQDQNKLFSTQNLIKMGLLSAIAVVLMQYGAIKLPMLFPSFLEIDFSEVPAIIAILTINPMAGLVVIVIKNLLKLLMFGSSTGGSGELANMVVSIGYILPLMWYVKKGRDLKTVTKGIMWGILGIAVAGALINYFVTLPIYANLFMPMETIIEMGHAIFPAINSKLTFVLYSIVPFNIFKGVLVAIASVAFIKAIYPMLKYLAPKRA